MMHKSMGGIRHSDHVALLVAFEQWLRAHRRGETSEAEFCERKCLNMQVMRMTMEARNQLKDIMRLSGFPDECLSDEGKAFDPNNADSRLDLITSLLTYALYPNVCYHTEKRKLVTCDGKQALIHKNSVNCGREISQFPSPFFVFGEKIKTRAVSAKQMTMVSPLQLMVFSSDRVETVPNEKDLICLDNWIYVRMERELAAVAVACRSALDAVISLCTVDPNLVLNRQPSVEKFVSTMIMLSDQNNCHVVCNRENASSNPTQFTNSTLSESESGEPAAKKTQNNPSDYFSQFSSNQSGQTYFENRRGSFQNRFNNRGRGFTSAFNNNNRYFNNNNNNRGFDNNRNNQGLNNRGFDSNNNNQGFNNNNNNRGFGNNNGNNNNNQGFNNNRANQNYAQQNEGFNQSSNRPMPPHLMSFSSSNEQSSNFQGRGGRGGSGGGGGRGGRGGGRGFGRPFYNNS